MRHKGSRPRPRQGSAHPTVSPSRTWIPLLKVKSSQRGRAACISVNFNSAHKFALRLGCKSRIKPRDGASVWSEARVKSSMNLRRYWWTLVFLLTGQFSCVPSDLSVMAQEYPEGSSELDTTEQNSSRPNANSHPKRSQNSEPASQKTGALRGELVIAPLPISSPARGTGIVPIAGYIFPPSTRDQVSPPSVIAGAGLVTDNGSRAFAMAGDFYFKDDRYHAAMPPAGYYTFWPYGDMTYTQVSTTSSYRKKTRSSEPGSIFITRRTKNSSGAVKRTPSIPRISGNWARNTPTR